MKRLFASLLLSLSFSYALHAQIIYGLDPSFANNGLYIGDTGGYGSVVVQPDDKIIVSGNENSNGTYIEALRRFNQNGTIDVGFANNGLFRPDVLGYSKVSTLPVCIQPDGKILLGGGVDTSVNDGNFLLIRLKQNGSLDSSFGGCGYIIPPYENTLSYEDIRSIALQPDGKILAYGLIDYADDTLQVMRFHPNGVTDSSFGIDGRVKLYQGITYPTPKGIAIMTDGRIVLGADAKISAIGTNALTALRLLPDGRLDTSFNHTGLAYTVNNLSGLLYCRDMCLQPDGKVLVTGYADSMAVVRFDMFGQLDNSFGNSGVTKIAEGAVRTMELQPDGKILVAGMKDTGAIVCRLLPNGGIDNGFAVQGVIYTTVASTFSDVALQSDGKLLTAGVHLVKPPGSFTYGEGFIARFYPNATIVNDPEKELNLTIYPNPATDYFFIDNLTKQKILQINLYSSDGKLLLNQTDPYTKRLSTEGLANGVYYFRISFANHATLVKKVLIQKR